MIIKAGVDIVQIPRISGLLSKFGLRFCTRVLHLSEIQMFEGVKVGRDNYLAKRFAAKEAVAKAFGFGIGRFLNFRDIIITKDQFGAPNVALRDSVLPNLLPNGYSKCEISISISDDYPIAVAFAVITFFL